MSENVIRVVAAVVKDGEHYLITQRRSEAVLGGLWEFPGGRVEPGEADEQALRREFRERLGAEALIGERLAERTTDYGAYAVTLALYSATIPDGAALSPVRVRDVRWIRSDEFERYPFPAADRKTMDALLGLQPA